MSVVGFCLGAVLSASCGPGNGAGMYITGNAVVNVTDAAGTGPTATPLTFAQRTRVDATLQAGTNSDFTGVCSVGPNGRSVRIDRVSQGTGVQSLSVTMPDWSQDSCASCQRGVVNVTTLGRAYQGIDTAGSASSQCRITATRGDSLGMVLMASCTGLTTTDGSHADLTVNFTLEQCEAQSTTGH